MIKKISKTQAATAIAIFFHCIGLAGLLFFDKAFFIRSTPFNLLLSFFLLVWTQTEKNKTFLYFGVIVFFVGFFAEVIGVNTGLLFGNYSYGKVLGTSLFNVPLIIGINWFIVIYCCGVTVNIILKPSMSKMPADTKFLYNGHGTYIVSVAVLMAVIFDWIMEPVAINLGFWRWGGAGNIPWYNYFSWLLISLILLLIFIRSKFKKENKFAINLLLVQALFFVILRTFLK